MNITNPTKTVYCYYFPEVREIISRITKEYPHDIYLRSVDPGLDDYHEKAVAEYVAHMKDVMPGLVSFPYRYTSAGASESIFHIVSNIKAFESHLPLYVLDGEYEGYAGYGENIGLKFTSVSLESSFEDLDKGIFFISNPSARNGNILPNELIEKIGNAGHEIVLDATYAGLTDPRELLVDHPSIRSVIISLSKPFGLYYYRIGFCFSRKELLTLYVNKWFKNILSHRIAEEVLVQYRAGELAGKYRSYQKRATDILKEKYNLPIQPSDVLLLAHIHDDVVPSTQKVELAEFKRGDWYRFCLTPFYLEFEKNNIIK